MKDLKDISWNVDEATYRADKALSYSTLSRFKSLGFNGIKSLFDKVSSPSLTFGSCVDSIITGGKKEFDDRFIVAEFPELPSSIITIVKDLFNTYSDQYNTLDSIPYDNILNVIIANNYQNNWKPETRVKVIKEKGGTYYNLLYLAKDKELIDTETYNDVLNAVNILKSSSATQHYFCEDNPFDNVKRYYQLKFKAILNNIDYRCMADELLVNYDKKIIIPIDLKTSSSPEWDFYKSFIKWHYSYQARLYWRIIRDNLDRDEYFKDFKLLDYRFIVVNKKSLCPLVWQCEFTQSKGTLNINGTIFEDPEDIGKELNYYLSTFSDIPIGIKKNEINSITEWLEK